MTKKISSVLICCIVQLMAISTTSGAILASTNLKLPENAKRVLDRTVPGWRLLRNCYSCSLNGDNLDDYALALSVGKGKCLVEYYVALIADSDGFSCLLLSAYPASSGLAGRTKFLLKRKGEKVPNFDIAPEEFDIINDMDKIMITLEVDAVQFIPLEGCCATTMVFRNGKFRMFTSSD